MSPIATRPDHSSDQSGEEDNPEIFTPLTREQAQQLREQKPPVSPWRVLGWQVVVGLVLTALAWAITGKNNVAASVLYGAGAVVLPGALFARGLTGPLARVNPGSAVFAFMLWEVVKIALTVAMLVAAPKVVAQLSWPGLLVGLVVTMKVVWLAFVVRPKPDVKLK